MKIYRSSIDEFSELARAYLFDKKGFETATELYHKYEEAKKQESDAESELILFNKTLSEYFTKKKFDRF